eukprot:54707-Eustigmatos_ZCMA.PRE.1
MQSTSRPVSGLDLSPETGYVYAACFIHGAPSHNRSCKLPASLTLSSSQSFYGRLSLPHTHCRTNLIHTSQPEEAWRRRHGARGSARRAVLRAGPIRRRHTRAERAVGAACDGELRHGRVGA